jgi:hypothetical protein
MVSKELEQEIKLYMAERLSEGVSLSDIQKEVNSKYNVRYTYMDIRILASALDVDWKARNPQAAAPAPAEEEKDAAQDTAEPAESANAEAAPAAAGNTVVEISKIARPGVALSGTVKFANGSTADWFLDQTGRLGLDNLVGDNPTKEDVIAFQQELQRQLGA